MNKILIADDNQQITSILANYARKRVSSRWWLWMDSRRWSCLSSMKKYRRGTTGRDDAEAGRVRGLP